MTGRMIECPIDEMNRPRGAKDAALRIPPSGPEVKTLFAGWGSELATLCPALRPPRRASSPTRPEEPSEHLRSEPPDQRRRPHTPMGISPWKPERSAAGRADHGQGSVAANPVFTAAVVNTSPRSHNCPKVVLL